MRTLGESQPMTTAEAVSLDTVAPSPSIPTSNEPEMKSEDEDDTLSYFARLANDG